MMVWSRHLNFQVQRFNGIGRNAYEEMYECDTKPYSWFFLFKTQKESLSPHTSFHEKQRGSGENSNLSKFPTSYWKLKRWKSVKLADTSPSKGSTDSWKGVGSELHQYSCDLRSTCRQSDYLKFIENPLTKTYWLTYSVFFTEIKQQM